MAEAARGVRTVSDHHLAQINVSRLSPRSTRPRRGLRRRARPGQRARRSCDRLRLEAPDGGGNATAVRAFDDPLVIVNLSVWESIEALEAFAYRDEGHRRFFVAGASGSSGTSSRTRRSGGFRPGRRRRSTRPWPARASAGARPDRGAFTFRERSPSPARSRLATRGCQRSRTADLRVPPMTNPGRRRELGDRRPARAGHRT